MAKLEISTKRLAISKANAQIVVVIAVASFVTVFCLVASRAVWSQTRYQARVTTASEKAHQQLDKNIKAFDNLVTSYKKFDSSPTNIIGGVNGGAGDNDGDNAKIILDALPSTYDFPALTSSLEKILTANNFSITSISGTDDQVNQQKNTSSPNPQPVSMPFSFSVDNSNYASVILLITKLQQSIRPIQIDSINLSGGASSMTLTVTAHTYYQPEKALSITKQVIQ
jgi:competence transcription factor ComK